MKYDSRPGTTTSMLYLIRDASRISLELADFLEDAMTSAWSRLIFAMRRISEIRGRGLDPVPTGAFHILQSYMEADDRDKVLEWAAA